MVDVNTVIFSAIGMFAGFTIIGLWILGGMIFKRIFAYDVEVEHLSSDGKSRFQKDFARRTKIKGVDVVQLWKNKIYASLPPKESVKYSVKGRKKFHLYLHEDGMTPEYGVVRYPTKILEPLTTEQRSTLMLQYRRSAERMATNKWASLVMPLGFGLFAVIGLIMLLAFWKDLYEPVKEARAYNEQIMVRLERQTESMERTTNLLYELETGKQVIRAPTDGGGQTIPSGGGG